MDGTLPKEKARGKGLSHDRLLKMTKASLSKAMRPPSVLILALATSLIRASAQEPAAEPVPAQTPAAEKAPAAEMASEKKAPAAKKPNPKPTAQPNRRQNPKSPHQRALAALDLSHQKLATAQAHYQQAKAALATAEKAHDEAHAAEVAARPPLEKSKSPQATPATPEPPKKAEINEAEKRAADLKKRAEQLRKNSEKIQEAPPE